jgi:hypothetical protein
MKNWTHLEVTDFYFGQDIPHDSILEPPSTDSNVYTCT